jgi:glycosyltransferase involved in cell wall biosynthesis
VTDEAGARPEGGPQVTAIHQFVPALIPRDATGSHTILLREALRRAGWRSEIFAEATHDELIGETVRVEDYPERARPGDVLVYQFSTSSVVADLLAERPEPLVLHFHNVTDPSLYGSFDPEAARRSAEARRQLAVLAPRAVLGVADSEYNRIDLVAAGCRRTAVSPVLVDLERVGAPPDPRVAARLAEAKAGGGADWLFVGRLVPSKGQHDLIKALWAYRRLYDPDARLHLVGVAPSRRYLSALRGFIDDLGLGEAVRITGEVTDGALAAYYGAADVYVSASVHEGFGVPLLEAFRSAVPVVALDAGAVAATMAGAGLVLDRFEASTMAAAVDRVARDGRLRRLMIEAGREVVARHSLERTGAAAVDVLSSVAGPPPVLVTTAAGVGR